MKEIKLQVIIELIQASKTKEEIIESHDLSEETLEKLQHQVINFLIKNNPFTDQTTSFLDELLWANHFLSDSNIPLFLKNEYVRLKEFFYSHDEYAGFLQLKDLYEIVLKFPILLYLSKLIVEKNEKNLSDSERDLLSTLLEKPISLGTWESIARHIVKNTEQEDGPIFCLLKSSIELFSKVSFVAWRNKVIGHGALGSKESSSFINNLQFLLKELAQYLNRKEIRQAYHQIRFVNKADYCIEVAGEEITLIPLFRYQNGDFYFFDSLSYRNNKADYLSYITGNKAKYTDSILNSLRYAVIKNNEAVSRFNKEVSFEISPKVLMQPSNRIMEPKYLFQWLQTKLQSDVSGIYHLQMEEGMGKTTFSNLLQERNMFSEIHDSVEVRTIHFSRYQDNQLVYFQQAVVDTLRIYKRNQQTHLFMDVKMFPQENPKTSHFIDVIQHYHRFYQNHIGKKKLLLVIDGLDEVVDERVFNYFVQSHHLPENIYILYTSRPNDDLSDIIKNLNTSETKIVRPTDEGNLHLIDSFIKKELKNGDLTSKISELGEHTFLYVQLYVDLMKLAPNLELSQPSQFIAGYVKRLEQIYGSKYSPDFITVIALLAAAKDALSLNEIVELLPNENLRMMCICYIQDIRGWLTISNEHGVPMIQIKREPIREQFQNIPIIKQKIIELKNMWFTALMETDEFNEGERYAFYHLAPIKISQIASSIPKYVYEVRKQKECERAIAVLKVAIKQLPEHRHYYQYLMAELHFIKGDFKATLKALDQLDYRNNLPSLEEIYADSLHVYMRYLHLQWLVDLYAKDIKEAQYDADFNVKRYQQIVNKVPKPLKQHLLYNFRDKSLSINIIKNMVVNHSQIEDRFFLLEYLMLLSKKEITNNQWNYQKQVNKVVLELCNDMPACLHVQRIKLLATFRDATIRKFELFTNRNLKPVKIDLSIQEVLPQLREQLLFMSGYRNIPIKDKSIVQTLKNAAKELSVNKQSANMLMERIIQYVKRKINQESKVNKNVLLVQPKANLSNPDKDLVDVTLETLLKNIEQDSKAATLLLALFHSNLIDRLHNMVSYEKFHMYYHFKTSLLHGLDLAIDITTSHNYLYTSYVAKSILNHENSLHDLDMGIFDHTEFITKAFQFLTLLKINELIEEKDVLELHNRFAIHMKERNEKFKFDETELLHYAKKYGLEVDSIEEAFALKDKIIEKEKRHKFYYLLIRTKEKQNLLFIERPNEEWLSFIQKVENELDDLALTAIEKGKLAYMIVPFIENSITTDLLTETKYRKFVSRMYELHAKMKKYFLQFIAELGGRALEYDDYHFIGESANRMPLVFHVHAQVLSVHELQQIIETNKQIIDAFLTLKTKDNRVTEKRYIRSNGLQIK